MQHYVGKDPLLSFCVKVIVSDQRSDSPVMDTMRGLLLDAPIGTRGLVAVAWSVTIALGSYLWAKKLYNRDPVR